MKKENIGHLPTLPPYDPNQFKHAHEEFLVNFDEAEKAHDEKLAKQKQQQEKTKAFVARLEKDPAFWAKTEGRRQLVRDLEREMNRLSLDADDQMRIMLSLWKAAEDPEYGEDLFKKALLFSEESQPENKKADVWGRAQRVPRKELLSGLMKAIEHEPETEMLEEKKKLDKSVRKLEKEYGNE